MGREWKTVEEIGREWKTVEASGSPHFLPYIPGVADGLLQNRDIYLIRTNSAPNGWGMVAGKTGWVVLSGC